MLVHFFCVSYNLIVRKFNNIIYNSSFLLNSDLEKLDIMESNIRININIPPTIAQILTKNLAPASFSLVYFTVIGIKSYLNNQTIKLKSNKGPKINSRKHICLHVIIIRRVLINIFRIAISIDINTWHNLLNDKNILKKIDLSFT